MTVPDFETVWAALPHPAIIIDARDRIVAVNTAAEVFTSRSQRRLEGRNLSILFEGESPVRELVQQVRRDGVLHAQHGIEIQPADHPPRPADVQVMPIGDEASHLLLTIQPRAIAEKMTRSLSHRASARAVIGMAEMLAHEIKNPLAGISGAAQLLAMGHGAHDRELLDLIEAETRRITQLLEHVEQFGDLRPVTRQPVNIHDVLDRARLSAVSGFADHVRFRETYDPSLPPTVGDADQLIQVFLNLLKNAAEATPPAGAEIEIKTAFRPGVKLAFPGGRRESLPLEISVTDNGAGVPDDLKRDLFDPFVSGKAAGRGLGLSLVSKIIADHRGVVECESEPGRTTFRVLLPLWEERVDAHGAAAVRSEVV
ncbi:MAG: ATP-binding protein [Pseudomonadota bacterium]